jgi:hypothetical protein
VTPCTVVTGFFVLRRCGRPPVAGCPDCRRPICATHVAEQGLCPDCAARRGFFGHPASSSSHHRRGFRSSSSRDFGDASMFAVLNEFDRAPFDPGGAETDYDADGGGEDDRLVDS